MSTQERHSDWCFCWTKTRTAPQTRDRGAALNALRWDSNDIITISFLQDDARYAALKTLVINIAREWQNYANLNLSFRNDTKATLVRVQFGDTNSSSAIGKECLNVAEGKPTMDLGILDFDPVNQLNEIRRKVLHEFGHILGLVHEHQSPAAAIDWNKEAVYTDMDGLWDRRTVQDNIFKPVDAGETNYTTFDPKSIMCYPIKESWANNLPAIAWNYELSEKDRAFVQSVYP
jgi:serralysin